MVERATSEMLIGPDWAMNLEICDMLNSDPAQAKDVVKGIKKRIGSRNPKAQLLALTLLETIVKNCGDMVHMHVAEKGVIHEMVRIVKKKVMVLPNWSLFLSPLLCLSNPNWSDAYSRTSMSKRRFWSLSIHGKRPLVALGQDIHNTMQDTRNCCVLVLFSLRDQRDQLLCSHLLKHSL
jgi:predicted transcriptional regulator with HTH domain